MQTFFNFGLNSKGIISTQFLNLGYHDFISASDYVKGLSYKRNANKEDQLCLFKDSGGTCSTKHAVLKNLAIENDFSKMKLMLGIFLMNENNTPKIAKVLKKYNLDEMPEAHNYLRYQHQILDCTRKHSSAADFVNDLVEEVEIEPSQITNFKEQYHRDYLKKYLNQNPSIPYNLESFWKIREECIEALQQ